ncbi:MFS transporter [Bordetella sp. H567]|uniref:MFS transporter n=1 Tax=Bordetella sp. H567 TaxID=1697043 RepID=UPI001314072E|nr:MFS transporter [Bordetella sp. H567]
MQQQGMTRGRIWIYLLLFTGCSINYIDRIVLSVAAQPVAAAFHLSTVQLGYLFSAFLWTYLVAVLPWGMWVDKYGTRRSTAAGMAIWSLATLATGASWSFASLFASRLAMGFGEGATYPAGGRTIREWMPAGERGLATVVFNCGGYAGPALGLVTMGYVVSELGWRGGFYVAGAVGFVWLLAWLIWFRQPEQARFIGEAERAKILAERGGAATPGTARPCPRCCGAAA